MTDIFTVDTKNNVIFDHYCTPRRATSQDIERVLNTARLVLFEQRVDKMMRFRINDGTYKMWQVKVYAKVVADQVVFTKDYLVTAWRAYLTLEGDDNSYSVVGESIDAAFALLRKFIRRDLDNIVYFHSNKLNPCTSEERKIMAELKKKKLIT